MSFLKGIIGILALPLESTEPEKSLKPEGFAIQNHGHVYMGGTYTNNISNSQVGALATGPGASAHGSVTLTQAEYRGKIKAAQKALLDDEDTLEELGNGIHEALYQFLRIAREIQVEQRSMAENQARTKEVWDEQWAKNVAKDLRPSMLPKSLEAVKAIKEVLSLFQMTGLLEG